MPVMRAWTYSQLEGYETCPRQYHAKTVVKRIKFEATPATDWGKKVHKAFENVFKYNEKLPEGMTQWQGLADKFASIPGTKLVEKKYAIDKSFQPCDYWESWS
jgi:ATP-dependent helicase/DNAse subunit B